MGFGDMSDDDVPVLSDAEAARAAECVRASCLPKFLARELKNCSFMNMTNRGPFYSSLMRAAAALAQHVHQRARYHKPASSEIIAAHRASSTSGSRQRASDAGPDAAGGGRVSGHIRRQQCHSCGALQRHQPHGTSFAAVPCCSVARWGTHTDRLRIDVHCRRTRSRTRSRS